MQEIEQSWPAGGKDEVYLDFFLWITSQHLLLDELFLLLLQ